ncbi:efflux RND transporter periplasmic adaptor subunit [Pseudomonas syringae]|uniref:efflux RND transporter periplasmic adaptor subunit n=1 Tax=Pseudomonas syringae TaxID=317 RepID=UPI00200B6B78|nr:efflux RND transporter periplasmic adaptor subunit [Pseudomonas syringae]MCK9748800.1 efflux RND transporter periplasmic adaptor subunit [Pseudomonas syringae pv. syringae]MDU8599797.1 efflux RND transporter periplasmic adaptor subunit [Pseudomonas syringae]
MRLNPDAFPALWRCVSRACGVVLITLMISGCGDKQTASVPPVRAVKVETVRAGEGAALRFIGTVRQQDRASLAFESAGTLTELRADIGDSVKPGQVLARLDPQPAQLRLQEAQAALRLARAQALERQRNYQRQQNLLAAGSVAQSVVESAHSSSEQASAELMRTQAELDLARRELDRTRLIAPFAGRVVARHAQPQSVLPAGQVLLDIESAAEQQVVAAVPLALAESLEPGDLASASSSADGTVGFDLALEGISPRADDGLVRTAVFRVLRPAGRLPSGVTLLVQMHSAADSQTLSVPVQALRMGANSHLAEVFVYQAGGTVAVRSVTLGMVREGRALVVSGLVAGEQVVTAGTAFLQDCQPVTLFHSDTRLTGDAQ